MVGLGLGLGLGLGWGWVGLGLGWGLGWGWVGVVFNVTSTKTSQKVGHKSWGWENKISSFPKRFYNPSGRVGGWVVKSEYITTGFSHRSECGNIIITLWLEQNC